MSKCPAHKLSRKNLKDRGFIIDTAESYNAFSKRSKDLYQFIDIVGLHPARSGVLAVQATSKSNLSTRVKKAQSLEAYWMWLACGNTVEFHGWHKPKHFWEVKLLVVEPPNL
jgi:hypothetical protein